MTIGSIPTLKKRKIIGIVGEDPTDTDSIINLLRNKVSDDYQFKQLVKNVTGSQLDAVESFSRKLNIEFDRIQPFLVIFIRDADGLETEVTKINERQFWFKRVSSRVHQKILLLNIYEIEALIFADIEPFNKEYGTALKGNRKVELIPNPKGELTSATNNQRKKFSPSSNPALFKKLDFEKVLKNCNYFKDFFEELQSKLA